MERTLQQLQGSSGERAFGHVMYSDDAPQPDGVPAADSPDAVFTQGRGVLVIALTKHSLLQDTDACLNSGEVLGKRVYCRLSRHLGHCKPHELGMARAGLWYLQRVLDYSQSATVSYAA